MSRKNQIERDFDYVPNIEFVETNGIGEVILIDGVKYQHVPPKKASKAASKIFMMAAMYGTDTAVKLLLESGADPALKNNLGLSALDFATQAQKPTSVEAIASALRARRPAGTW